MGSNLSNWRGIGALLSHFESAERRLRRWCAKSETPKGGFCYELAQQSNSPRQIAPRSRLIGAELARIGAHP